MLRMADDERFFDSAARVPEHRDARHSAQNDKLRLGARIELRVEPSAIAARACAIFARSRETRVGCRSVPAAVARRFHRVAHEHGNSERADAAGYRSECAGNVDYI